MQRGVHSVYVIYNLTSFVTAIFLVTFSSFVAKNSTEKFGWFFSFLFTQLLDVNHSLLDFITVSLIMSVISFIQRTAKSITEKFKYKFKQSRIQYLSYMNKFNSNEKMYYT